MKLAIDISSIPYGTGVSRYTANLVKALAKQAINDQLVLFGSSLRQIHALRQFTSSIKGVHVTNRLYPVPPTIFSSLTKIKAFSIDAFASKPDVFHAWDWSIPNTKHAQLVTTVHDLALFKYQNTAHPQILAHHQQALKNAQQWAKAVIVVSNATKRDLLEYTNIPSNRIHVIPEALPSESVFDPSLQDIISVQKTFGIIKPYFLIVGTNEPRKNIPNMIKAWHKSFQSDFQLVIVGKSAWDDIPSYPGVIQLGYQDGITLACLFAKASALLYCSLYEGFGLPILEAFHYKIPVVTTNNSSLPEVAGNAAVFVNDPHSVDEINQAMATALEQQSVLVEAGTMRLAHFSWSKTAKQTLAVYHSLFSQ